MQRIVRPVRGHPAGISRTDACAVTNATHRPASGRVRARHHRRPRAACLQHSHSRGSPLASARRCAKTARLPRRARDQRRALPTRAPRRGVHPERPPAGMSRRSRYTDRALSHFPNIGENQILRGASGTSGETGEVFRLSVERPEHRRETAPAARAPPGAGARAWRACGPRGSGPYGSENSSSENR